MTHIGNAITTRLRHMVFPPICFGCKKTGDYLCKNCKKSVKPHPETCPFCHRPTKHWLVCLNCKSDHRHLEGIIVWFIYTSTVKKLITTLKWGHRYHIAPFLAQRLALLIQSHELLGKQIPDTSDVIPKKSLLITSVPAHRWKKFFVRGYSQSECLARALAAILNVTYTPLFIKSKYTQSQTKLTRSKRLINLLGAFSVEQNISLRGDETVLIVDDVTTTWATIDELARTLKEQYKLLTIWGIVVGRHGK